MKIMKCSYCNGVREVKDNVIMSICEVCQRERVELKEEKSDGNKRTKA